VAGGQEAEYKFDVRRLMSTGQRIIGIVEGDSAPDIFIPRLIELYEQGRFPFDQLVTYYQFDQINAAMDDAHHGKTIKPIVRF